jgi:recombination protein RecT
MSSSVSVSTPTSPAANQAIIQRLSPVREYFTRLAGEERYLKEASFAAQIIASSQMLQSTSVESQVLAFQALAESNLTLNPVMKLAHFVPRKGRCILEPSYQGMAKLLTDTGSVRHIEVHVIYANDECELDMASDKKVLRHVPAMMRGLDRGEVRGVYSIATLLDGSKHIEVMSAEEINQVRETSEGWKAYKAKKISSTPWSTNYEEMARKTVLKRHCKHLPKSERWQALGKAIDLDNADYDLDGSWRPQLAAPRGTNMSDGETRVQELMAKAREAFKAYRGSDKNELKRRMAEEAGSGRQNADFWEEVIIHLTGNKE